MIRTYSEMIALPTFKDRYKYLKLSGSVGAETFGFDRWLNQVFYNSRTWRDVRNKVILRDDGCDLGIYDRPILGRVYIHHMNPITAQDINDRNPDIFNPEYLICVSHETHNAIHYGDESQILENNFVERKPNDTCPWK